MRENFKVDFICVGPERSGTTWLYQCLKEHPNICVSKPKEVNFFNSSQSFWRKDLIGKTNYDKGLKWYKKHFSYCSDKKIVGEFTPIYLHSPEVPERIYKNFPNVKLIAILRNPIERFYSHYSYTKLKGFYKLPPIEEVIKKEREFVEESLYFKHLQNYLRYFPRENMLVTIYEDIDKSPKAFIKEVLEFLQVNSSYIPPSTEKTINSAGAVAIRNKMLSTKESIERIPGGKFLIHFFRKTSLHKILVSSLATKTGTIKTSYGRINPEVRKQLVKFYKEDVGDLEKLLGRDLSIWKYY